MKNINRCVSINDLRLLAKKNIPRVAFDYIDGAAEDEITMQRNSSVFRTYGFRPRVLKDVTTINLKTKINDTDSALPVILAPTGLTRLFHYKGEEAVVKAANKAQIPYTLSTVSTTSIEDTAAVSTGGLFFQIYIWHNRDWVYRFLDRCKTSGYKGIYLAVDSPVLGKRERDLHHGHGTFRLKINMALSSLARPNWLFRFLTSSKLVMGNMTDYLPHGGDLQKVIDTINDQSDASVSWEDAKKIKDYWGEGPFLLKGIQSVEDAKKAVDIGASGIVLSNHGGRQLDGAPTALELLPRVKEAVKDQLEILIDGGITRGSDIIKAIALGADACMIGRAYLYGLAAGGEKGVDRALSILKEEMERVMALIGCRDINELNASYIERLSPIP